MTADFQRRVPRVPSPPVPPAGGPFLHGPGNQFSGAHDHVSVPHYFIPLSRSRLYRGLMRRAGNRWRTNKRVYLLNKAGCPSPRIAFYFAQSHDSRSRVSLQIDRVYFPSLTCIKRTQILDKFAKVASLVFTYVRIG